MSGLVYSQFVSNGTALSNSLSSALSNNANTVPDFRSMFLQTVVPKFSQLFSTALIMNASYNNSNYISKDMQQKIDESQKKEMLVKSSIQKARYSYMQKKRQIRYNRFVSGVMQGTILVVCILFTFIALNLRFNLSRVLVISAIVTILILFLVIIMIVVRNNTTRRVDDWDKFYFAPFTTSISTK